ncbi:MAG: hypothetical protein ACYTGG_05750 [Planctomycetota bacterium]|jgi:hypothetical protein
MREWAFGSLLLAMLWTPPVVAQSSRPEPPRDPRHGLLTPIPSEGSVPPIIDLLQVRSDEELATRARIRDYVQQIRRIRHKHFGRISVEKIRAAGIERLMEFTDPAAFRPMIDELLGEADDVRLAVLDHFAAQGDEGQAALARVAIYVEDEAMRHEAMRRLVTPAPPPVLRELDQALRSPYHAVADNAGALAGTLNVLESIPLLIFSQATEDRPADTGDLAWIAVQTQHVYVQRLEPVVAGGAAAFQPIPGIVSDGFVLQIQDAVVVIYRTNIHRSLVTMTSQDWGESTEHLGYDMRAWWEWYNREYVPHKNAERRLDELVEQGDEPNGQDAGSPPPKPPSSSPPSRP